MAPPGKPFDLTFDPSPEVAPEEIVDERDQRFGRYRLRYQLGSGGMASVFLARVTGPAGFDKPVAIKRMHPHLARRREFVDMFLDEAKLTSRIDHPNVCTVFDFGEAGGSYYMAMEYLVGEPLTVILAGLQEKSAFDSGPWRAFAARILADTCEGLHAAHELKDRDGRPLQVVHRDVSPSNLFVTFDGAVKVVDFGVAKAHGRLHHTTTGTLKGKFSYMSPEQVQGQEVDRQSDVFSLGICLWEMICGRRLFRRKTEMEMMQAVSNAPIPPPSRLIARMPPGLEAITMRALERDPARRYPTARAMGRELRKFLQHQEYPTALPDLSEFMDQLLLREHTAKLSIIRTVMGDSQRSQPSNIAFASTAVLQSPEARAQFGAEVSETRSVRRGEEPSGREETGTMAPAAETAFEASRIAAATGLPTWAVLVGAAVLTSILSLAVLLGVVIGLSGSTEDEQQLAVVPIETDEDEEPEARAEPTDPDEPDEPAGESEDEPEIIAATPQPSEPREPDTTTMDDPEEPTEETAEATVDTPPAMRPRMRPATSGRPGRVNITTTGGWADIYVRGRRRGRTPGRIDLPPGRHTIELRPFGQPPSRRVTVNVRPGGSHPVRVPIR